MSLRPRLSQLGPGIAIAATGVGAGDLLAAMIAGAEVGTVVLWPIVWGTLLKFALNEGIARWQLATGETFLEEGSRELPAHSNSIFSPPQKKLWVTFGSGSRPRV